jgi:hypothetical protein
MKIFLRARVINNFLLTSMLYIVATPSASSQQNLPIHQVTVLTFVHDFLQVFYPELISKGHALKLAVHHPADTTWSEISGVFFTVTPERPPDYGLVISGPNGQIPETRPDPDSILLDGSIWLPPLEHGSRVQQVLTTPESAHEQKLTAFRNLVESHPEWSDEHAISALKQAGARFGPDDKDAFLRTLPLDKMERFLGHLKVTSVEFSHLQSGVEHYRTLGRLDWSVHVEAQFSDGTSSDYQLVFEPFQGKLTMLSREP